MTDDALILQEMVSDGVVRITLNNPPLNIISRELTAQLDRALTGVEEDPDIRVLIITGSGNRAFSAGSDIKEFSGMMDTVVENKLQFENHVFSKLADLPIPTIAAIQAAAYGGGSELALACDLRVMSSDAVIGFPEIKLGWFPGSGGLYRLPYLVGPAVAKELMLFGEPLTADQALKIGLVNRVVDPKCVVLAAEEMARVFAERPGMAVRAIKRGVNQCFRIQFDQLLALNLELSRQVFASDDTREGIAAFFGKRQASFQHR